MGGTHAGPEADDAHAGMDRGCDPWHVDRNWASVRVYRISRQACITGPFYAREFGKSLFHIGFLSLPVVGLAALFTGGALALQIYSGGARFSAEAVVPQIVAIGMVRELGPVLVGLMIAARVT